MEMMRLSGGEELLLEEIRAVAKHLDIIDVQLPVQRQWIEAMQALHEPLDRIDKALQEDRDRVRSALRELRGELAGIRTHLDSLMAIQKQLEYHGARLSAIEKRLTTLVETRVTPLPVPSTTFQSPPGPAG
jgi:chromosome segregation ATPase